MTLNDPNPDFKIKPILDAEYGIKGPYLGHIQWITNKLLHTPYSSV